MPDIPAGVVLISPRADGWFLVQIGRGRKVKSFWLSHAEASQLADLLAEAVREKGEKGAADR
jgi:hypothetical protein